MIPTPPSSCKLLFADDDPIVCAQYRKIFLKLAAAAATKESTPAPTTFTTTIVNNSKEAIQAVQQGLDENSPYPVIFLDVRMPPGIDGVEAAKIIRQLDCNIYIVFVSAYSDHTPHEMHSAAITNSFRLRKPFHNEEIQQLAISICNNWHKDRLLEQMVEQSELEAATLSLQNKSEFFASMSHEFRTPLTTIIGNSELLIAEEQDEGKLNLLNSIASTGYTQLSLINEILDLSKIEHGNFSISHRPYSLDHLIDNIRFIFHKQAHSAGLAFHVEIRLERKFKLIGDMQRISQILINLVGNAIKYTPQGAIHLTVCREGADLLFSVVDSGVGIPIEEQPHIFRQFNLATERSLRAGVSGLGLFISMALTEMMGGTLSVTSTPGEGSTFNLRLPYQESTTPVETGAEALSSHSTQLQGRVLVQGFVQKPLRRTQLQDQLTIFLTSQPACSRLHKPVKPKRLLSLRTRLANSLMGQ
jgi:two-component system sensor histidine kinase/response regulator